MITPAKWQTAEANQRIDSQMSYGEFRKKIVPHMKEVIFYPSTTDIFDIETREGVTYYLIDKELHPVKVVKNIIKGQGKAAKCLQSTEERQISNRESLLNSCNEIYNHIKDCEVYKTFKFRQKDYSMKFSLLCSNQLSSAGGNMYTKDGSSTVFSEFQIFGYFNMSDAGSHLHKVWQSDNIDELLGVEQYLTSKLVRFLILGNISTRNAIWTDDYFRFVPDFPYSNLQHTYNDNELYKLFGLSEKQIELIETVIRPKRPLICVETLKRLKNRQMLLELYNQIKGCNNYNKLKLLVHEFYNLEMYNELSRLNSEYFNLWMHNKISEYPDVNITISKEDKLRETYLRIVSNKIERQLTLDDCYGMLHDQLVVHSRNCNNKWEQMQDIETESVCKTIVKSLQIYMIQDTVIKQKYLAVSSDDLTQLLGTLKLRYQIKDEIILISME